MGGEGGAAGPPADTGFGGAAGGARRGLDGGTAKGFAAGEGSAEVTSVHKGLPGCGGEGEATSGEVALQAGAVGGEGAHGVERVPGAAEPEGIERGGSGESERPVEQEHASPCARDGTGGREHAEIGSPDVAVCECLGEGGDGREPAVGLAQDGAQCFGVAGLGETEEGIPASLGHGQVEAGVAAGTGGGDGLGREEQQGGIEGHEAERGIAETGVLPVAGVEVRHGVEERYYAPRVAPRRCANGAGQQPAANVAQEERGEYGRSGRALEGSSVDGGRDLRGQGLQQAVEPELCFAHVGIAGGGAEPAARGWKGFEHTAAVAGRAAGRGVAECQAGEASAGEATLHGLCVDDGGWIDAQRAEERGIGKVWRH